MVAEAPVAAFPLVELRCQNDDCAQFKKRGQRRFIGALRGTGWYGQCPKCYKWHEYEQTRGLAIVAGAL